MRDFHCCATKEFTAIIKPPIGGIIRSAERLEPLRVRGGLPSPACHRNLSIKRILKRTINEKMNKSSSASRRGGFPLALALLVALLGGGECGCRIQERNSCETICQWNATHNNYECTLRAIVILPKMESVEASLPRVSCGTSASSRSAFANRCESTRECCQVIHFETFLLSVFLIIQFPDAADDD